MDNPVVTQLLTAPPVAFLTILLQTMFALLPPHAASMLGLLPDTASLHVVLPLHADSLLFLHTCILFCASCSSPSHAPHFPYSSSSAHRALPLPMLLISLTPPPPLHILLFPFPCSSFLLLRLLLCTSCSSPSHAPHFSYSSSSAHPALPLPRSSFLLLRLLICTSCSSPSHARHFPYSSSSAHPALPLPTLLISLTPPPLHILLIPFRHSSFLLLLLLRTSRSSPSDAPHFSNSSSSAHPAHPLPTLLFSLTPPPPHVPLFPFPCSSFL